MTSLNYFIKKIVLLSKTDNTPRPSFAEFAADDLCDGLFRRQWIGFAVGALDLPERSLIVVRNLRSNLNEKNGIR